jgi:hypothetical protein
MNLKAKILAIRIYILHVMIEKALKSERKLMRAYRQNTRKKLK